MTTHFGWIFILLFAFGCATPSRMTISGDHYSLRQISDAIAVVLPTGLLRQSINLREFTSNYFNESKQAQRSSYSKKEERSQATIKILGDRRPYQIVIEVKVERREAELDGAMGEFQFIAYDQGAAQELSERILKRLSESTKERNIIDDFRAF